MPIEDYKINIDPNPEVIKLNYASCVERVESLAIKYLKPPQPPAPGHLVTLIYIFISFLQLAFLFQNYLKIITQLPDYQPPEAPPLVIRQLAPQHVHDPKPLVNKILGNKLII